MFPSLRRLTSVPAISLSSSLLFVGKAFAFGGDIPADLPGQGADIRTIVTRVLTMALNLLALLAAVVIVIAGIRLIFSMGDEEGKETAKKTILYAVIGLLVVLFARAIVTFITQGLGF